VTRTLTDVTLVKSRTADRVEIRDGRNETPIAQIRVNPSEARDWRVTLGRAERRDGRPPLVPASSVNNSSPLFSSQIYGYAAGFQNTPQSPPVRDNPVAAAGSDVDPLFVEIAWGMAEGGVHRILGHWPMQGASIVLYGSFVEVTAGTFLTYDPGAPLVDLPVLQASIAPTDGLSTEDSGELSLQHTEPITVGYAAAGDPAVVFVPDYARRVKCTLLDQTTGRAFEFGNPRCILEWFSDTGAVVESSIQGSSVGAEVDWLPVPARATLLRIGTPGPNIDCNEPLFTACQVAVHWRLSP